MNKRKPYVLRLVLSFILATILFISIFLVAFGASYLNYQSIISQNNLVSGYIDDLDNYLILDYCGNDLLVESSERLESVGLQLNVLEKRFGKNDERVLEQKELYSVLELKHFEIIKKFNSNCGSEYVPFFFFYSNIGDSVEESESVGYILSHFKIANAERAMIYSFDYNLDSEVILDLKERYNVTSAPMVVANEFDVLYLYNIDDLDPYI